MQKTYLIRYSPELVLKGKNRVFFEEKLIGNIKHKFPSSKIQIKKVHRRIFLYSDLDQTEIEKNLGQVFGISSFSRVYSSPLALNSMIDVGIKLLGDELKEREIKTFCVQTKRPNKKFQYNSQEVGKQVGTALGEKFPSLKVQFDNPDFVLGIEIRDEEACLFTKKIKGASGFPVGTGEKLVSLLSGGIDSPVASWFMMRRGSPVIFATFHSPPFLEEESYEKILSLAKSLARYQRETRVYKVFFTDVQKAIKVNCHDQYRTLLYRRMMHRIASKIAEKEGAMALVTGESLGQVASQTLHNLLCISDASNFEVMRPLIGMEKEEIIQISKKIGTYDISIQPFGDCCTLFAPQSPTTKGNIVRVQETEKNIEVEKLMLEALEKTEIIDIPSLRAKRSNLDSFAVAK